MSATAHRTDRVPVIALTGHLGAGKTTVLNHLLRQPGARLGVVVNDFGAINVDAGLVAGQVDEAASIAGGCVCCLDDAGGLDVALEKLTHPRLALDAVIVEASGLAEPLALARLIRFSGAERVRFGGLIDVVDAVEYFHTVDADTRGPAPIRFQTSTLVVVNKLDRVPAPEREATLARITARVREQHPSVHVVSTSHGRIDPTLVYDVASTEDPADQLPIGALLRAEHASHHDHQNARSVSVSREGPVDPVALLDLLSDPPPTAYRLKGQVCVGTARGVREYVVHVVGRDAQVHDALRPHGTSHVVAIGPALDTDDVRRRLEAALVRRDRATADGWRRLQRRRRLSL